MIKLNDFKKISTYARTQKPTYIWYYIEYFKNSQSGSQLEVISLPRAIPHPGSSGDLK